MEIHSLSCRAELQSALASSEWENKSGYFTFAGTFGVDVLHALYPHVERLLRHWVNPPEQFLKYGHVSNVVEEEFFCVENCFGVVEIRCGQIIGVMYGWRGYFPFPVGHVEFWEGGQAFVEALFHIFGKDIRVDSLVGVHYAAALKQGLYPGCDLVGNGMLIARAFATMLNSDDIVHADLQPGSLPFQYAAAYGFLEMAMTVDNLEGEDGQEAEEWSRCAYFPKGYRISRQPDGKVSSVARPL